MNASCQKVDLDSLVGEFYAKVSDLGVFLPVQSNHLPAIPQSLLAHESHMTETVEKFHNSKVNVVALQSNESPPFYSREILLKRQSDGCTVQYGIVRINFQFIDVETVAEIRLQQRPLGRILIDRNVLRVVRLDQLFEVTPTQRLQELMELKPSAHCFGRTALIYCGEHAAIELLEIVP